MSKPSKSISAHLNSSTLHLFANTALLTPSFQVIPAVFQHLSVTLYQYISQLLIHKPIPVMNSTIRDITIQNQIWFWLNYHVHMYIYINKL